MKATYLISGLCCIAVILTMPFTLKLYGLSQEARRLGGILVLIHNGCAILIWPASFCLANVLRAANDVKFPMCVSIGSMVVFRIGFSFLLAAGLGMGAVGVWCRRTSKVKAPYSFPLCPEQPPGILQLSGRRALFDQQLTC